MRHKVLGFGFPFRPCFSSNSTRKPLTFDWTDDPSAATLDTCVCMGPAIRSEINRPGRKIAWLAESPAIDQWQHTTPFIESNLDQVMAAYELVLSSDRAFCKLHPRIVYHPAGANLPWIKEEEYALYRKTKMCSMFASKKKMVASHLARQGYAERFKHKLDLFGGAAGSQRIGGNTAHPDKSAGLLPYRFQVVMENCKADFYYTEKITDCFATGTIPVYWGSDCVGEVFDTDGILIMEEGFDPDDLCEDQYWSMMPAIRNNLHLVRELEGSDDQLFRKFLATRGSVTIPAVVERASLPWSSWAPPPFQSSDTPELSDRLHLDIVRDRPKTTIDRLDQVPPGIALVRPCTSQLEMPRTAQAAQQPDQWYPQIDNAFLLQLNDAYFGDNVVFDRDNYYRLGRWWAGNNSKTYCNTNKVTRIDKAVLVSGWGGRAFQHFILDAIPQLAGIIDLLETPQYQDFKIITHLEGAKFANWFWDKLGLRDRVVQKPENADEGRVVFARQALFWHFAPSIDYLSVYPRDCLLPVQQRLGIFDTGEQNLVLYLRRPNRDRSVANEAAILSIVEEELRDTDLELCLFESAVDWQQDLEIFSRAKLVIGPHGGAMANIVFCRPGTHVLEFVSPTAFSGRNDHLVYYGLCQAAGHHYWFSDASGFDINLPQMTVNEGDVRTIIRKILN